MQIGYQPTSEVVVLRRALRFWRILACSTTILLVCMGTWWALSQDVTYWPAFWHVLTHPNGANRFPPTR